MTERTRSMNDRPPNPLPSTRRQRRPSRAADRRCSVSTAGAVLSLTPAGRHHDPGDRGRRRTRGGRRRRVPRSAPTSPSPRRTPSRRRRARRRSRQSEKLVEADQEAAAVLQAGERRRQVRGGAGPSRGRGRRQVPPRRDRAPGAPDPRVRGGAARAHRKLDQRGAELDERDEMLHDARMQLEKAADQHRTQLERIAGMTSSEAREELVAHVVDDAKRSAMAQVREIEQRAREEGEERARKILTIAIQRVASEQTAESTVSVFALPSEDMKGRIIGREGRNIRAFEATTGVNIIIDDTPEAVVLCSFDPVRREAARMTLEKLVQDGRIHPARIEEVHERSLAEIEEQIRRAGEDAVAEVGITDIHPEMIKLLGRLQYRTSYGQNVLRHLVESRPHRLGARGRARGRPGDRQAGRVPARHRQGRDARGRGLARDHRRRDRAPHEGGPRGRPLHRVAPRRGRAAHDPRGARPDRRLDQRRPPRRAPRVARDLREAPGAPGGDLQRASRASRRSTRCRPAARSA